MGPFVEPETSPVLVTDESKNVISPGHHTVFRKGGRDYILYHRHGIPFDRNAIGRQVCVDELHFTPEGRIEKVTPTHEGPVWVRDRSAGRHVISATATASSGANANTSASFAVDDNYATYWSPAPDATGNWLRLDLGRIRSFAKQEIRFEYAWKPYRFRIETSEDGSEWRILSDHLGAPVQGSPVVIDRVAAARYVRLTFPDDVRGGDLAVFEWTCYR